MDERAVTRGIRGGTTVEGGGEDAVARATGELLDALIEANGVDLEDVAAAIFTVTDDLAATNPAAAARGLGWDAVPLLQVREHGGDTRVPRCLRVLVLWNTSRTQSQIHHVYLRGAAALRPDLEPMGGGR